MLGPLGENIAKEYLQGLGYKFVEANYRTRFGEIDLIMQDNEQYIFVEVKTRTQGNQVTSNQELPPEKLRRLQRAIDSYLSSNLVEDWRVELVAVTIIGPGRAQVKLIPV